MMFEFHSPTFVCSYSVADPRVASQAWGSSSVRFLGDRIATRVRCWPWFGRTYLGGDLGQLLDRDGLQMGPCQLCPWIWQWTLAVLLFMTKCDIGRTEVGVPPSTAIVLEL